MADRKKYPRIQFYVPDDVRDDFYESVGKRFGKTSGGAVSDAGCEALKMWIGVEKAKEKRKDMYQAVPERV
jgi:hypothetical protein